MQYRPKSCSLRPLFFVFVVVTLSLFFWFLLPEHWHYITTQTIEYRQKIRDIIPWDAHNEQTEAQKFELLKQQIVDHVDQPDLTSHVSTKDPCLDFGSLKDDDPLLIACLRKDFLVSPSTEPYNLANPNKENPTQHGQTQIALKLLNNKKNGTFIECGAFDGEESSNTLYLERKLGWSGLLIEAEAGNYKNLARKHRKSWISHACLSPKTTAEKLTLRGIDQYGKRGLTLMTNSTVLMTFKDYARAKSPSAQVQCFPLYSYFLALNLTEVDYFSLDTEGADFGILKTVPFDKIKFMVLEVEITWIDEGKEAVRTFLESHGYKFMKAVSNVDYIFVHESLKLPENLLL